MSVVIRAMDDSDLSLVYDSWLKSLRHDQKHRPGDHRLVHDMDYFRWQREAIDDILVETPVWVACDPEDEGNVMGWACGFGNVLHYVYVKELFRGHGVARELIAKVREFGGGEPLIVTHLTSPVLAWRERHPIRYNPYLAWR